MTSETTIPTLLTDEPKEASFSDSQPIRPNKEQITEKKFELNGHSKFEFTIFSLMALISSILIRTNFNYLNYKVFIY